MSSYELRPEQAPANPVGLETLHWHITRLNLPVGLCGFVVSPVAEATPISEIDTVEPRLHCPDCWMLYTAAVMTELPPR